MRILASSLIFWGVVLSVGCQANSVQTALPSKIPLSTAAEIRATAIPNASTQRASTQITPSSQIPPAARIVVTIMNDEIVPTPMSGDLSHLIDRAKEDLAQRVGTVPEEIELLQIEKAEWPDTSLGCAKPGLSRRPVAISGYRIVLRTMEREFEYHTNRESGIVFCPKP